MFAIAPSLTTTKVSEPSRPPENVVPLPLPVSTMSAQELRKKLFENIRKTGLADKLKSQLRSRLIAELRLCSRHLTAHHYETNPPSSILQRAVDSLLLDYLRIQRYEFTLSVFLPDSGLNTQQPFSETDILKVLRLDHSTPFSRALKQAVAESPKDGLLRNILSCLAKVGDPRSVDVAVQTRRPVDSLTAFENRMISYQKECDDRAKNDVETQMNRFREHETMKLREEEKGKFKREVQRIKTDFEKTERERIEKFRCKEEELKQKFERMEKELKATEHVHQQKLHAEIATAKAREQTLKREQDLNARAAKLECEMAERKREEVELRLRQLELQREENAQTFREETIRLQTAMDHEKTTLLSDLKVQRANLEGERNLLQEKLRVVTHQTTEHDHLVHELEETRKTANEAQSELQYLRKQSIELTSQVATLTTKLQEETKNTKLEYEIFTLKKQVLESERCHNDQRPHTEEIARLRRSELKWQRECQALVTKLDYETSRNEERSKRLDDEILRNKELQRETAELRMLLHQAQMALTNQQNRMADSMHETLHGEYQTDCRSRLANAVGYFGTTSYTGGYIGDPVVSKHHDYYRDLGPGRVIRETGPEFRHTMGTTERRGEYSEDRNDPRVGFFLPESPSSGYVKEKSHRELVSESLDRMLSGADGGKEGFSTSRGNGNRNESIPGHNKTRRVMESGPDLVDEPREKTHASNGRFTGKDIVFDRIGPGSAFEATNTEDRLPNLGPLHDVPPSDYDKIHSKKDRTVSEALNDRSNEYLRPSSGFGLMDPLAVNNECVLDETMRGRSLGNEEMEADRWGNSGMENGGRGTKGDGRAEMETQKGTHEDRAVDQVGDSIKTKEETHLIEKLEDEKRRRAEKEKEEEKEREEREAEEERTRRKEAQDQEERKRRQEKLLAEREEQEESIRRQQRLEETRRRKQQEEMKVEFERLKEESERQKREEEERKQNEENEKMQRIQKAAEDPVMQRYMAIMKEKREREGTYEKMKGGEQDEEEGRKDEEEVIQQGSTEAELSVPNESEGEESSELW